MAIIVREAYTSGPLQVEGHTELRVREFYIESTAAGADVLWTEADVAVKVRSGAINVPRIGDAWESLGYTSGAAPFQLAQPEGHPADAFPAVMKLHAVSIHKEAVANNRTLFRYVCMYSTMNQGWQVQRSLEIASKHETVYYDYDSRFRAEGFSDDSECRSWASITGAVNGGLPPAAPPIGGPPDWSYEGVIREGEGAEALRGQLVLNYRQLVYAPDIALFGELAYSTNKLAHPPDVEDIDKWLFAGVTGSEVRNQLYDLTFKFVYDTRRHRATYTQNRPGSTAAVMETAEHSPFCRSYRVYPRKDWSPLWAYLVFP